MIIPHPYGDVYIEASAVVAILPIQPRSKIKDLGSCKFQELEREASFQVILRGKDTPLFFSYATLDEAKKARESAMSAFFKEDKKGYANDC